MSGNARFAIALVVLWFAFACFFVAFHPGGIQVNGQPAQNPSDVFKYAVQHIANPSQSGSGGSTTV